MFTTTTNKMVRVFGVAFLFAAMLIVLFNGPVLRGTSNVPTASADSFNITAKFDTGGSPINGDSKIAAHTGEVSVTSFDQSVLNTTVISNSGITPGKTVTKDITFTKGVDTASVPLYRALSSGGNIATITFTFGRPNGSGGATDFYQVTYSNVRITSIEQSVTLNNGVVETVTFAPSKTTWTTLPALGNQSSYGWDFINNGRAS